MGRPSRWSISGTTGARDGPPAPRRSRGQRGRASAGTARGRADVHVRAGRGARHGSAEREEWDAERAEVVEQRAALGAVRMHGDVSGVPVVEAEPVVDGGLAEGA